MEKSSSVSLEEADIVNQLDELLVEHLELMDVYIRSALDEEISYKNGLMSIAHARMCIKPNLINLEGYPNETTQDLSAASTSSKSDNESHRVLNIDTKKDKELLKIFGTNTPASLKKAQVTFQRVLEGVFDRANIVQRLKLVEEEQLKLKEKQRIIHNNKTISSVEENKENLQKK